MEKLRSYLVTRLLMMLGAVLLLEGLASFLVRRLLLPAAANLAHYTGELNIFNFGDYLQLARELVSGKGGLVMADLTRRSGVILLLVLSVLLILMPVVLGVIWYTRRVLARVEKIDEERQAERAAYDAQRNLMFSDFAHDLRTPIMTISGYAGALSDGVVKDEAQKKQYLTAIRAKADRMSELITLLFDYTKLGSVNFHLKKEPVDLNELLRETAASAFSDMEDAGMELLAEIPEEPYVVSADRAQVSRVVGNLLTNAIRHNPAGTKIAVGVRRLAGMEMIAVADTGVAIEKDPKQLFEPFVKGDDSRSETKGSGLGLSIAKKIVDMHGWEIELKQPFGKYTKAFVISVPERT
ncbi:MAG: HAMP domain-containing histidine kinase [Lachnospiraceae bacterium]|nr:HAMP domain-containing histidine kinase [Lachnospiraceae bacterium]